MTMRDWFRRRYAGRRDEPAAAIEPQAGREARAARLAAELAAGRELFEARRYELAGERFSAALGVAHDCVDAHMLLGMCMLQLECHEEAADAFILATHFRPDAFEAHFNHALAASRLGRNADAIDSLDAALALQPEHALAHNLRGVCALAAGSVADAVAAFRTAVALDPACALAHNNLGYLLLRDYGEQAAGADHIERAQRLAPEDPDILCNYGLVLLHRGRLQEALALCDRLLEQHPQMHEARLNRALVLLALGRFESAWDDFEARMAVRSNFVPRTLPWPAWQGEELAGKAILVYGEQGLGDEIMFASCFGEVIARAGRCVIECAPRLQRLFRRSFPTATVVAGEQSAALPLWMTSESRIEVQLAAGSLPRHFRRSLRAFPQAAGYLSADPARIAYWRGRLDALGPGRKIGVSWRGGTPSTRRELRSTALDAWAPLMRTPGCRFVSLQYGAVQEERDLLARTHGIPLAHWQEAIDDIDECAALVCALDLVVTVCTALVHLTGALSRPARVLVPTVPEWRYLASGSTMPWYPTVRLYRQAHAGGWTEVLARVAQDLQVGDGRTESSS